MSDYFKKVVHTYIENWGPRLLKHSIPAILLPLSQKEVEGLLACNFIQAEEGNLPTKEDTAAVSNLANRIDEKLPEFPDGAFVRLGSRSPKDSYNAYRARYKCTSGKEAAEWLCDSERVSDDLHLAKSNNYQPFLVLRPWIKIEPWQEFRCFYRERNLKAISQYNYLGGATYPEIKKFADSIEWGINVKSREIARLLPTDNVIVDYIVKIREYGNERVVDVIMLEINPYMHMTDPCLFDWQRDTFEDFEFRYNGRK